MRWKNAIPEPTDRGKMAGLFAVAAVFVTLASGIGLLDSFRTNEARTVALVFPQGPVSTQEAADNVLALASTDGFRDVLFSELAAIFDRYGDLSGADKDTILVEEFSFVATQQGSGIIVAVRSDDTEEAMDRSKATMSALLRYAERYYNIRTEAEFRIVDGPTSVRVLASSSAWILTSLAVGVGVTGLFFAVLALIPVLFAGSRRVVAKASLFRPDTFLPVRPGNASFDQVKTPTVPVITPPVSVIPAAAQPAPGPQPEPEPAPKREPEATPYIPEKPTPASTSPFHVPSRAPEAPSNLPAAMSEEEEQFFREFSFADVTLPPEADTSAPAAAEPENPMLAIGGEDDREPTEEEYKRRLNELLKGNL